MGGQSKALAGISTKETYENEGSVVSAAKPPRGELFNNLELLFPKSKVLSWGGVGTQGGQRGGARKMLCSWVSAVCTAEGDPEQ